jgi:hypothetical protein
MIRSIFAAAALLLLSAADVFAADLPDPDLTPGAVRNADVGAICRPGSAKAARHTPQAVKEKVYREYGITNREPGEYEVDHLISLELGGADVAANLWPQSYLTRPWNAHVKDRLENWLHAEVCAGRLSLQDAQQAIAGDWIRTYRKYLGEP